MNESATQSLHIERVPDNVLIASVPGISEGGITVLTRENLAKLVEAPLLEACEDLYDKNIQTVMSSANASNVGNEGYISVVFDSLSDENKAVALEFGQPHNIHGSDGATYVNLTFPIGENTTVGEIRKATRDMASKFHKQPMSWSQRYMLEDMAKIYGIPAEELSPENFPDKYYDRETGYLYDSEEHFHKVKDADL